MPKGVYVQIKARKKHSLETRKKMSLSHLGFKHTEETKRKIGIGHQHEHIKYRGLHRRIEIALGKANHCEKCGLNKIPKGRERYFNWSNTSGEYKRDLSDWRQLCVMCHAKYDKQKRDSGEHKKRLATTF